MVMENTSAQEAGSWWQRHGAAPNPGCPGPMLLDMSWFTECMAAGQPVPVESRHSLEVRGLPVLRAQSKWASSPLFNAHPKDPTFLALPTLGALRLSCSPRGETVIPVRGPRL